MMTNVMTALATFATMTTISLSPCVVETPIYVDKTLDNPREIVVECDYGTLYNDFDDVIVVEDTSDEIAIESVDFNRNKSYIGEEMADEVTTAPYVSNQLVALIDDESLVYEVAEYFDFDVVSYEWGVAVFDTKGKDPYLYEGDDNVFNIYFSLNTIYSIIKPVEERRTSWGWGNVWNP